MAEQLCSPVRYWLDSHGIPQSEPIRITEPLADGIANGIPEPEPVVQSNWFADNEPVTNPYGKSVNFTRGQ